MTPITKETLRAYLHDALTEAELASLEKSLRDDAALREQLEALRHEEDRGEHSLGAIWRREHLSCPTRAQLGGYVLQSLDEDFLKYIEFHIQVIACPFCAANLDDLQKQQSEAPEQTRQRQRRIVKSGIGMIMEGG